MLSNSNGKLMERLLLTLTTTSPEFLIQLSNCFVKDEDDLLVLLLMQVLLLMPFDITASTIQFPCTCAVKISLMIDEMSRAFLKRK